jgi:deferrochelatase/peroxidase EfeB
MSRAADPRRTGPSIKPGEFILGYPDEKGETASAPIPEELRRNGSFVAIRKFHLDVAAFRRYLRENASSPEEEELIAAKMVGRWRSGAPLVLAPERDDPLLGADAARNNAFTYANDMHGLQCPFSAHIRRVNPRDALKDEVVAVNLHHFLRRGTNYGPPLPEGVLDDDGAERGGVFLLIGAHLQRQFEFVQSQWAADGNFIAHGTEQDPLIGNNDGDGVFTIPHRPARRRAPRPAALRDRFAAARTCFLPGSAGVALARDARALAQLNENIATERRSIGTHSSAIQTIHPMTRDSRRVPR